MAIGISGDEILKIFLKLSNRPLKLARFIDIECVFKLTILNFNNYQ